MKTRYIMWAIYDTEKNALVNIYSQKKRAVEEIGGSIILFKLVKVEIKIIN